MINPLITLLAAKPAGAAGVMAEMLGTVGTSDVNAEMMAKDPHGLIMTLTSVSVVFLALLILFLCYSLIGKLLNGKFSCPFKSRKSRANGIGHAGKAGKAETDEVAVAITLALKEETSGEVQAAIALALEQELNEYPHDQESYIITIKR